MQRLSFLQATHIVETCVESKSLPTVALQTSSSLDGLLKHKHSLALTGEDIAALQTAKSAAYYDNVIFHTLMLTSFSFASNTTLRAASHMTTPQPKPVPSRWRIPPT